MNTIFEKNLTIIYVFVKALYMNPIRKALVKEIILLIIIHEVLVHLKMFF